MILNPTPPQDFERSSTAEVDEYLTRFKKWLEELQSAPADLLMGISQEERKQLLKVKQEAVALEERLLSISKEVRQKEKLLNITREKAKEAKLNVEKEMAPLERVLQELEEEEETLRREVVKSGHVADLKEFLERQESLHKEEIDLKAKLLKAEDELQSLRDDMCEVDESNLNPNQRANVSMYITWKKLLAEKNRKERELRELRYLSKDRQQQREEMQWVIAEVEKKAEILRIKDKTKKCEESVKDLKERVVGIESAMKTAVTAMQDFKKDFEQMRVAIMLDKTIKTTEMATLTEHKKRLEKAESWFEKLMEKEADKIRQEEAQKWEDKIEDARREAANALELERSRLFTKLKRVKTELGLSYQEGFEPLLKAAQKRYQVAAAEARRLQEELAEKERMLADVEEEIREINTEVEVGDPNEMAELTEEEKEELANLQVELKTLWKDCGTSQKDIASFYAELDFAIPYNDTIYEMYKMKEEEIENKGKVENKL